MLKIRRPLGRLIFNMGIAIPGKTIFLIETAPWTRNVVSLTLNIAIAFMTASFLKNAVHSFLVANIHFFIHREIGKVIINYLPWSGFGLVIASSHLLKLVVLIHLCLWLLQRFITCRNKFWLTNQNIIPLICLQGIPSACDKTECNWIPESNTFIAISKSSRSNLLVNTIFTTFDLRNQRQI